MASISNKDVIQRFGRWSETVIRTHDGYGEVFAEKRDDTINNSMGPPRLYTTRHHVFRQTVFRHDPFGETDTPLTIEDLPSPKELFKKRCKRSCESRRPKSDILSHIRELQNKRAKMEEINADDVPYKEVTTNVCLQSQQELNFNAIPTPYIPLSDRIFNVNGMDWRAGIECEEPLPSSHLMTRLPPREDTHAKFDALFQISEE